MNLRQHKRNRIAQITDQLFYGYLCPQFLITRETHPELFPMSEPVDLLELYPELEPVVQPSGVVTVEDLSLKTAPTAEFVLKRKKDDVIFGAYFSKEEAEEQIQKAKAGRKAALYLS